MNHNYIEGSGTKYNPLVRNYLEIGTRLAKMAKAHITCTLFKSSSKKVVTDKKIPKLVIRVVKRLSVPAGPDQGSSSGEGLLQTILILGLLPIPLCYTKK